MVSGFHEEVVQGEDWLRAEKILEVSVAVGHLTDSVSKLT
jgi:hypothetical protein